ncbi:hypothetical protein O3M35_006639 [Rhynocoris fuscipes]|uniref:Uncharacterized protein n=1 Tax=Rhynocoris fuscipes TaxID=488301 RepID=A0AAW1DHX7_9HEMI
MLLMPKLIKLIDKFKKITSKKIFIKWSKGFKLSGSLDHRIKLKYLCRNNHGRPQLHIKLELNTFRNDRMRTLNVFCALSDVAPLLSRYC